MYTNKAKQHKMTKQKEIHIPHLSQDEQIFLNTTATFSQFRRMSNHSMETNSRPSMESNHHSNNKRHQVVSVSSLSSFLFKRRRSSTSSLNSTSSSSMNSVLCPSSLSEDDYPKPQSPKARELESLIFEQPQRTIRLSLTPRCAV